MNNIERGVFVVVDKEHILDEIDRVYNNMSASELRRELEGLKLDQEKRVLIDEIVKFKYNVELSELYTDSDIIKVRRIK